VYALAADAVPLAGLVFSEGAGFFATVAFFGEALDVFFLGAVLPFL
jgi:hypothetical protein